MSDETLVQDGDLEYLSRHKARVERCKQFLAFTTEGEWNVLRDFVLNETPKGLALNLADYRRALGGEGPLAAQWKDKPHRLVYDLCTEISLLRGALGLKPEPPEPDTDPQWFGGGLSDP